MSLTLVLRFHSRTISYLQINGSTSTLSSLLLGKNEQCPSEMLNLHVPGFTGGRGGRGQGGGGSILEIALSWTVPHNQLEPHHPIQDTHSVESYSFTS